MDKNLLKKINMFLGEHRSRKKQKMVVSMLAVVVVFFTAYILLIPASTAERDTVCGLEEHIHNSECYQTAEGDMALGEENMPICGKEEHKHVEECYAEKKAAAEPNAHALDNAVSVNTLDELKAAINNSSERVALNGDVVVTGGLTLNANMILDLNGHRISTTGTGNIFNVNNGISLTIMDNTMPKETVSAVSDKNLYGNRAMYENNTLTYYVTKSKVKDSATGATTETLEEHRVTASGMINCGSRTAFNVAAGGTLNIESGVICSGTNRAVNMNGGTFNMSGGYLCGFNSNITNKDYHGGAVYANNGSINLTGGVIAANVSGGNGGGIAINGTAKLNIDGGIISGNVANRPEETGDGKWNGSWHSGGGGIFCNGNSEVIMNSGYLTNNNVNVTDSYFGGGGGAMMRDKSSFILNGGYVTGNVASGGGGLRTVFQNNGKITMNGGFVSGNKAVSAEGGGIAVDQNGWGTITGGYITNNIADTKHWGGGGLFCADGSTLEMKKILITDNSAAGFGGGIAGCPTGRIYLYSEDGGATFDNKDMVAEDSPHYVGEGVKQIDQELCNELFQANGHKDYFCALRSSVLGSMLGGGASNWTGTADYKEVNVGINDVQTAERIMGLEARPNDEAKNAAINVAAVYVNGNYSNTHGGGILCNGNLIFGNSKDIEVPAHLILKGKKSLQNEMGKDLSLENNEFKFVVSDKDGKELATGACDKDGNIKMIPDIIFEKAGTHEIYIRENTENPIPGITYDEAVYKITATVTKDGGVDWYGNTKKYTHNITSIKVEKSNDGKEPWTEISNTTYNPVINTAEVSLTSGNRPSFINIKTETTNITVNKVWSEGTPGADEITVKLYHGDQEYTHIGVKNPVKLNKDNKWIYTWRDLPVDDKEYTVKEVKVPGYNGSIKTDTDGNGNTVITITNTPGFELPETGGIGTIPYIAIGLMLMGTALFLVGRRKRQGNN